MELSLHSHLNKVGETAVERGISNAKGALFPLFHLNFDDHKKGYDFEMCMKIQIHYTLLHTNNFDLNSAGKSFNFHINITI